MDKLKYELFNWLWCIWHMRSRSFFDRFAPSCPDCANAFASFEDAKLDIRRGIKCHHAKYVCTGRPWWHLCCNGDTGGWRTAVCDWLEHKWRYTRHYSEG